MLTDTQLQELLAQESDRVERKQSLSDPDKAQEAICAFANDLPNHDAPGVLYVGVRDDGTCAGLAVDDELLLHLGTVSTELSHAAYLLYLLELLLSSSLLLAAGTALTRSLAHSLTSLGP